MADEKFCDNCHWLSLRDEERLLRIQDLEAECDSLAAQNAVLREALAPCVQRPFRDPRCSDVQVLISEDDYARAIEALADPAPRAAALLAMVEAARAFASSEWVREFLSVLWQYNGEKFSTNHKHREDWQRLLDTLARLDGKGE